MRNRRYATTELARTQRLAAGAVVAAALIVGSAAQGTAGQPGELDRSFSGDGRALTDFGGRDDQARAVAVQENGRILVAGRAGIPDHGRRPALVRYRPNGRLDRSFAGDGKAVLRRCPSESAHVALALEPSGKLLVATACLFDLADLVLARFLPNGRLDRSFGRRGMTRLGIDGVPEANAIATTPNGKIVVVGSTGDRERLILARFRRSGRVDRTFAQDGKLVTDFETGTYVRGDDLAIQRDGKLVVSGTVGNNWMVARFLRRGALDPEFADEGIALSAPLLIGEAFGLALDGKGRILVGGTDYGGPQVTRFALARYRRNGSLDPTFGGDGAVHTRFGEDRPAEAYDLALQPNRKIVLAGTGAGPRLDPDYRLPRFALARYRPNGALDRSFGDEGRVLTGFPHGDGRKHEDYGRAAALQRDGDIVVAGYSVPFGKDWDLAVAQLESH